MTSSVMSICACVIRSFSSPRNGLSVPKASEWRTTSTAGAPASAAIASFIPATTSARFSASAAFTFQKIARPPAASISPAIRSTFGSVARRSRWTPKTFRPAFARATEAASPNPEDAPRTRAQFRFGSDMARIIGTALSPV